VGVVGCLVKGFPGRALREGYHHYLAWVNGLVEPDDIVREIFVESPLVHPSVVMRRHMVERLGGYREFDGPEDYDLWLRFFMEGIPMAKVPKVLFFWRERGDRLSRTDPRYHRSRFWEVKAGYLSSYLARRADLKGRPLLVWGQRLAGRLARRLMKDGIALAGFININRHRQGGTRLGLPIYPPQILSQTPGAFVICGVSTRGARGDIRRLCRALDLEEGKDYLMAG
jgi:GT2 family glycosyltransferase